MKKKAAKRGPVPEHACPICGKMTTNPSVCSRECYSKKLKLKGTKNTLKLASLDNTNRCAQCGAIMPTDRYSMYCEACELHIEYD